MRAVPRSLVEEAVGKSIEFVDGGLQFAQGLPLGPLLPAALGLGVIQGTVDRSGAIADESLDFATTERVELSLRVTGFRGHQPAPSGAFCAPAPQSRGRRDASAR